MRSKKKAARLLALIFALALAGCRAAQPVPTPTETTAPTLTPTAIPTDTPTPLPPTDTATPEPTDTPTPRPTATRLPTSTPAEEGFSLTLPTGEPLDTWNGFPIMPDAIAGRDDTDSYVFTVAESPAGVQEYYEEELGALGWSLFAAGEGENGGLLLIFLKGADMLTLSVIPVDETTTYVLIIPPGY